MSCCQYDLQELHAGVYKPREADGCSSVGEYVSQSSGDCVAAVNDMNGTLC